MTDLRNKIAKEIYSAMTWAAYNGADPRGDAPEWDDKGVSTIQEQARQSADTVLAMQVVSAKEAARVLLVTADYMPPQAQIAAVKVHAMREGNVCPLTVARAWRAALRALAEQDAPE